MSDINWWAVGLGVSALANVAQLARAATKAAADSADAVRAEEELQVEREEAGRAVHALTALVLAIYNEHRSGSHLHRLHAWQHVKRLADEAKETLPATIADALDAAQAKAVFKRAGEDAQNKLDFGGDKC